MQVEIVALQPAEVEAAIDPPMEVAAAAFAAPPYGTTPEGLAGLRASILRHTAGPGYRYRAARAPDGTIVGFAYGYAGGPGQWWYDAVAPALGPERAGRWPGDYLEFVELAVAPAWQGRGIGGRLHDAPLAGALHRTAALSTLQAETAALRLYRRRGWQVLVRDFLFPGGDRPYLILGLPLRGGRP